MMEERVGTIEDFYGSIAAKQGRDRWFYGRKWHLTHSEINKFTDELVAAGRISEHPVSGGCYLTSQSAGLAPKKESVAPLPDPVVTVSKKKFGSFDSAMKEAVIVVQSGSVVVPTDDGDKVKSIGEVIVELEEKSQATEAAPIVQINGTKHTTKEFEVCRLQEFYDYVSKNPNCLARDVAAHYGHSRTCSYAHVIKKLITDQKIFRNMEGQYSTTPYPVENTKVEVLFDRPATLIKLRRHMLNCLGSPKPISKLQEYMGARGVEMNLDQIHQLMAPFIANERIILRADGDYVTTSRKPLPDVRRYIRSHAPVDVAVVVEVLRTTSATVEAACTGHFRISEGTIYEPIGTTNASKQPAKPAPIIENVSTVKHANPLWIATLTAVGDSYGGTMQTILNEVIDHLKKNP